MKDVSYLYHPARYQELAARGDKEEIAAQMREIAELGDPEGSHSFGDRLLLEIARAAGYAEAADIFEEMDKWYA